MGSGLIHCAVSNQVIGEGETIVVIPILQTSDSGRIVKLRLDGEVVAQPVPEWLSLSDKYYTILGFVLEGVAEDYARQSIVPSHEVWEFLKALKQRLVPSLQGDNPYHEKSFNASDLDWLPDNPEEFTSWPDAMWWSDFTDRVHKYRVWFRGTLGLPQPIQFSVVLKSVWEDMLKGWEDRKNEALSMVQECIEALPPQSIFSFTLALHALQLQFSRATPLSYYYWWENMTTGHDILGALKNGLLDPRYQLQVLEENLNLYGIYLMPNLGYTQDYANVQGKAYAKMVHKASKRKFPR